MARGVGSWWPASHAPLPTRSVSPEASVHRAIWHLTAHSDGHTPRRPGIAKHGVGQPETRSHPDTVRGVARRARGDRHPDAPPCGEPHRARSGASAALVVTFLAGHQHRDRLHPRHPFKQS